MKEPGPRLGRGLASLWGESRPAGPDAAVAPTATDLLEPNPFQPRRQIDPAELEELTDSIRQQGILQPLLIRPHPTAAGRFQIVAGERRWRAAQAVGLTTVPCMVREMSDSDASAAALVENLQRQDLNPVDEALGYRRLIDGHGLTQDQLATAIGKSRSYVANTLRLLVLPRAVLDHVISGRLTAGHARAALAAPDPEAAARAMVEDGLSVREAEALAKRETTRALRPLQDEKSPDVRALEHDLTEQLGLRVDISSKGQGGTIKLHYRSLDQLDFVLGRLGGLKAGI